MAFRSAAYAVVARIFKLVDVTGFTRFFFGPKTLLTLPGYAVIYDDPLFNDPNTEAGFWASGSGSTGAANQDIAYARVYANGDASPPTLIGYLECITIDALTEAGVTISALGGARAATITLSANPTVAQINITCDRFGVWTALPLAGNYGNAGGAFQVSQYRKIGDIVQVRAEINSTGVNAPNSVVATLPAGFRPPATLQFMLHKAAGGIGLYILNAAGQIIDVGGTGGAGVNCSINIEFYTST